MSKLIATTRSGRVRLYWWIPESQDLGGALGDWSRRLERRMKNGDLSTMNQDDREMAVAYRAALSSAGVRVDDCGPYWDSEAQANRALRDIKAAWKIDKSERPWPEWARQAFTAGWRAPKGWAP